MDLIRKTKRSRSFHFAVISLLLSGFASSLRSSFTSLHTNILRMKTKKVNFPPEVADNSTFIHSFFMNLAIEEAKEAARKGEVPIGALVVEENDKEGSYRIVSRGYNMVETTSDATAHAEMTAMRRASKRARNWRLFNKTLYSTMEPCPICLSSAQAFRIHTIVYGAPQVRLGAIESYMRMLDDYTHPFHKIDNVIAGVMQEECSELLKDFFRKKRKEKPRVPMSEYIAMRKPFLHRLRNR